MNRLGPRHRGLTLIELMVTVAIVAILAAIAMPAFTTYIDRTRVIGAAEALAQDLQLAKSESVRTNGAVSVSFATGTPWCYGMVNSSTPCNCATTNSCTLRQVNSSEFTGVTLSAQSFTSGGTTFSPIRGLADGGSVTFAGASSGSLKVNLTASGQVTICSVSGSLSKYSAC